MNGGYLLLPHNANSCSLLHESSYSASLPQLQMLYEPRLDLLESALTDSSGKGVLAVVVTGPLLLVPLVCVCSTAIELRSLLLPVVHCVRCSCHGHHPSVVVTVVFVTVDFPFAVASDCCHQTTGYQPYSFRLSYGLFTSERQ